MKELTSAKWIVFKGLLFLLLGVVASLWLVLENLTWKTATRLFLAIWCFCRFYYFAFYVMERYVDSTFRFSGLISLLRHIATRRRSE